MGTVCCGKPTSKPYDKKEPLVSNQVIDPPKKSNRFSRKKTFSPDILLNQGQQMHPLESELENDIIEAQEWIKFDKKE